MPAITQPAPASAEHDEIPLRPVTLRDVLLDCGGPASVADELSLALTTVYDWSRKGRVPDSDLREEGGTSYSETIARMQRTMKLTPSAIRKLGRRI